MTVDSTGTLHDKSSRPTAQLRFVERTCQVPREPFFGGGTVEHKYRILQQAWASPYGGPLEWRDVPVETEK